MSFVQLILQYCTRTNRDTGRMDGASMAWHEIARVYCDESFQMVDVGESRTVSGITRATADLLGRSGGGLAARGELWTA